MDFLHQNAPSFIAQRCFQFGKIRRRYVLISRTYGLFRASLRISHFGTNQSTIHTKIRLIVCKCPYFYKKLRKHCLVQDADTSKQNLPTLMASKITVIWKSDFMDPMNLFPSDAKVTCICQQDCTYKYI